MNDAPLDLDALANAFLDDEATLDERALVAGDAELTTEIDERLERLQAVRALLGDVEPAAISTREAHLAAALSAWDRIPDAERTGALRDVTPRDVDAAAVAAAKTVIAPSRRTDHGRPRSTRWLTAAAAVVAVVAVGGIALRFAGDTGMDDDASGSGEVADADLDAAEFTAQDDELRTESAADATDGGGDSADSAGEVMAPMAVPDTVSTGINDAAPPPEDELVLLESSQDLADFALPATLAGGGSRPDDAPTATSGEPDDELESLPTFPECAAFDMVVGPAMYRETVVLVGIDESRGLVIAARIDDCVTVATARLP